MGRARPRLDWTGRTAPGLARLLPGHAGEPGRSPPDCARSFQIQSRLRTRIAAPRPRARSSAGTFLRQSPRLRARLVRPARGHARNAPTLRRQRGKIEERVKTLPAILLALLLAGFIGGLVHLFHLRFEAGDNYPPYSSLRADPLGAKALYESLDRIVSVRRHLQSLSKLGEGRDTTLLWLGDDAKDLRFLPAEFKDLETFVRTGGRLVIGLVPMVDRPRFNRFATRPPGGRGAPPGPGGAPPTNSPSFQPGDELADLRKVSIRERWNLSFGYAE